MKIKALLSIALLVMYALVSMGQAKRPTLMVVPSDAWCNQHGYMQTVNHEQIPDYKTAVAKDLQLNAIISKINTLMADRGFPLKDLHQSLKSIAKLSPEIKTIKNKRNDASIRESPLDQLRRTAKADIILEISWMVNTTGPKHCITYNLSAKDAYSNKQVAGAEGTGKASFSAEIPILLEEAVQDHMDVFVARLQTYFDDLLANGREVVLEMHVFEPGTMDFTQEYDGYELNEVIDNWLSDNCVNHRFNKSDVTETMILYEQVRIPLYKSNGMAQDTYGFTRDMARYFGSTPYNIPVKTVNQGLGRCLLVFGDGKTSKPQENPGTVHKPSISMISDVDKDIPQTKHVAEKTFAVIIANENYQEEVNVDYALNDGESFKKYCHKVLGLPESNIHIRKDATLNNIRAEISWMQQVADAYKGQAQFIVFYAGHGIPDEKSGTPYLLPVDGKGAMLETGFGLAKFYETLGNIPSERVTVFMDACFSGSKRGEGMLASARGIAREVKPQTPKGKMVVFSAAQGDETAYPLKDKKHGLFTYYLLKKLKDTKGDVTYGELDSYITEEVSRKSIVANGKSQRPTVMPSQTLVATWKTMKLK